MKDFKSIQDLIVKAAFYDRVSTTISADELLGRGDVIRITFSKDNRHTTTLVELAGPRNEEYQERANLYACKDALYRLLWAPYKDIEVNKEKQND